MSDIVERLRRQAAIDGTGQTVDAMLDAADEIEQLRAERRTALKMVRDLMTLMVVGDV